MYFKVVHQLLWIFCLLLAGDGIGISDKLDFNDDQPGVIKSHDNLQVFPGTATNYKTIKTYKNDNGFDDIGVICVSGGCNTTTTKGSKDVETDVVVHVKTKVNLNKSVVDDTPDIPIVVGSGGTNDYIGGGSFDTNLNVQPLVIDDLSGGTYSTTFRPVTPASTTLTPYDSNRRSFIPQINSFNAYQPSYTYGLTGEPRVDITLKSLPNDLNRNLVQPGFRNYYQTDPPQKVNWYPRNPSYANFQKPSLNHFNQNNWDTRGSVYHRHSTNVVNTCICKDEPTVDRQWINNNNRRVSIGDPGSQINDKLAPLN